MTVAVAAGSLTFLASFAFGYQADLWTTGARVGEEQRAERELDQAREPFTSSIAYDTSAPFHYRIVLDRLLTPGEQEQLNETPYDQVWDLLRPLGGRLIRYPSYLERPAPGIDTNRTPHATVFTMNLLSTRSSQLSIVDMTPTDISCSAPTARTVVEVPPQGEAGYPGVVVDLTDDHPVLYGTDEGPDQGQSYFGHQRIDLGGGLEPGGLRVEALVGAESCEWEIVARFRDARGNAGEVVLRDGDRPFRAEAVPSDPEHHWLASPMFPGLQLTGDSPSFQPCHEMPDHEACTARQAPPT